MVAHLIPDPLKESENGLIVLCSILWELSDFCTLLDGL
jgi:hypothetical protein